MAKVAAWQNGHGHGQVYGQEGDGCRYGNGSARMRLLPRYYCALRWNSGLTRQMPVLAVEEMSAVETGQMSAVETGQMFAVETRQMSSAETRQMYNSETGQRLVLPVDICLVSAVDICPFSTANICPVSTEDIWPVKTNDIWLLWGHLGTDENDFDPFFQPKLSKMEHRSWSRRSHGNDATGRAADSHSTRAGGQDYVSS